MIVRTFKWHIVIGFLGISYNAYSQTLNQSSLWNLGYKTAIDFKQNPPELSTSAIDARFERPSTICDENGNLLFYTNGVTVWNTNNEVMLNGDSITSIRQFLNTSSVIIPHPGDGQLYYIFISNPWNTPVNEGFHYSVVDMSGDGGLGAVIQKRVNLMDVVGDGLTVVADSDDKGFWVICHGEFNNNFYAYKVSESGISGPVISSIGAIWDFFDIMAAPFQASPDGTKIAAPAIGIELYDFNAKTGELSNLRVITDEYYGFHSIGFSPNSEVLYRTSSDGQIFQYDISSGDIDQIINSKVDLGIVANHIMDDLRLAYNGKIYGSQGGGQLSEYLVEIENPNVLGLGCNAKANGLKIGDVPPGLPISVQSYYRESPSVPPVSNCKLEPTRLTVFSVGYADSIAWDFGDGTTATYPRLEGKSVLHTYNTPGEYQVKARKYIDDIYRELSSTVSIGDPPVVNLGKDTTLCAGEQITLDSGPALSYDWSTGESSRMITKDKAGKYWVSVNNGYCTRLDTIAVTVLNFPEVELGNDITTCYGDPIEMTAPFSSDYQYKWSTGEQTSSITIDSTGSYGVEVSHGRCAAHDTITINYKNIHDVTLPEDTIEVDYGEELELDAGGINVDSWSWNFGDGAFADRSDSKVTHPYPFEGTYFGVLTVSNEAGCYKQFAFTASIPAHLLFPNVITANGDDTNDFFEVQYNGDAPVSLAIFDRWGRQIYFSKEYNNTWNGGNYPAGVYFYEMFIAGKKYSGALTILR